MVSNENFLSSEEDRTYNTPEKWYVREKWVVYALERKKKNHRAFIRLLTLTSAKAYDVKLFRDNGLLQLTSTGYSPETLTFCECNHERYVRIRNGLPGARDFFGELESFVRAGSAGFTSQAERWFPYDVVNLDFTKPGFRQKGRKTSGMVDCISKIFMMQGFKKQSFSLFLTFPAIKGADDDTGKSQLQECLDTNLADAYPQFRARFLEKYPKGRPISYREFLLVVVPKLIIRYGQSHNFDTRCRERCTYIGKGARTVMITFIFDCEYVGLPNGYGGENPAQVLARHYPERILEIIDRDYEDINRKFAEDSALEKNYLQRALKYT